jgi:hypothetical protein
VISDLESSLKEPVNFGKEDFFLQNLFQEKISHKLALNTITRKSLAKILNDDKIEGTSEIKEGAPKAVTTFDS